MKEPNQRVIEILAYSGLNKNQFAKRIDVAASTIGDIVSGEKGVGNNVTSKILKSFPELSSLWLLTGEGEMLSGRSVKTEVVEKIRAKEYANAKIEGKSTPYYPEINASAGMDFLAENGNNYNIPIKIPNVDAEAYINVFGDSMYPKYCSGEIIGIKKIDKDMVFFGHAYVIQMIDGEAYIKYIDPGKDDEHWMLRSENQAYKPKQFHLSKIRNIFVIKAVITKTTIL